MRIAVSGSHGTGKSTLIAAFLDRFPEYLHAPEAYETLADDISLSESEGPDVEGLGALLDLTVSTLQEHAAQPCVVFERSPVDYLAYAAASRSIAKSERSAFLRASVPVVRETLRHLDLVFLLPVSNQVDARPEEDQRFRRRVDEKLRRALLDDDHDLLGSGQAPLVVEASPLPDRQLAELIRHAAPRGPARVLGTLPP
ncbi:MAG: AAA family ATPase [Vicinamibacteria bacterium]